ncbi:acyltransferase domain-containing protein, partial [Streptomyces sp. P17]|uniref:acyltransferase domain-containing protein n=1 Tax=Streptomyces sp. P17 TaxID=3074716 RepID=UPI0028F442D8
MAWPRGERVRRAGVSSFGVSGTNAHVIVEEAPLEEPAAVGAAVVEPVVSGAVVPWVVSGGSAGGLVSQARALADFAREEKAEAVVVGRALLGRAALRHRLVAFAEDREGLLTALESFAEQGELAEGVVVGSVAGRSKSAFVFSGQGAQRAGMGRELYEASPVFARVLDEVCGQLDPLLGGSVREVMFAGERDEPAAQLDRTVFTQAALFAFEVALFRTVEAAGVRADYLAGHSVGELAAAHVAGVWSLEDACRLVAARGRLMQALPQGGAMASVRAGEGEVKALLGQGEWAGRVEIAAVNGPAAVVVSGDQDAVDAVTAVFEEQGRRVRGLRVSHAFHSHRMEPMLAEFGQIAASVTYHAPTIPVVSNVTGRFATTAELIDPGYWVRQVRGTVRFHDGVRTLAEAGVRTFAEIGPRGVLTAMVTDCLPEETTDTSVCVALTRTGREETTALTEALARLWTTGTDIDWATLIPATADTPELPTYAFDRHRYWLERTT